MKRHAHAVAQWLWYGASDHFGRRFLTACLRPLASLYHAALLKDQRRRLALSRKLRCRVISVGNITVGGTGKTPTVLWLAQRFREKGFSVAIVSRGYGRVVSKAAHVTLQGSVQDAAARFGDEPVLLARRLSQVPVWVGTDRFQAAQQALERHHADVVLLDDGFQHRQLHRDVDIVVLNAAHPLGNGRLLPAGPLREPAAHLTRAHALVFIGDVHDAAAYRTLAETFRLQEKPCFQAAPVLDGFFQAHTGVEMAFQELVDHPCVVVAGIGRPERFFSAVRSRGIPCARTLAFPDHHRWKPSEVRLLMETMRNTGARWILTTEKDAVRLPAPLAQRAVFVRMDLDFGADAKPFEDFVMFMGSSSAAGMPHECSEGPTGL